MTLIYTQNEWLRKIAELESLLTKREKEIERLKAEAPIWSKSPIPEDGDYYIRRVQRLKKGADEWDQYEWSGPILKEEA